MGYEKHSGFFRRFFGHEQHLVAKYTIWAWQRPVRGKEAQGTRKRPLEVMKKPVKYSKFEIFELEFLKFQISKIAKVEYDPWGRTKAAKARDRARRQGHRAQSQNSERQNIERQSTK